MVTGTLYYTAMVTGIDIQYEYRSKEYQLPWQQCVIEHTTSSVVSRVLLVVCNVVKALKHFCTFPCGHDGPRCHPDFLNKYHLQTVILD